MMHQISRSRKLAAGLAFFLLFALACNLPGLAAKKELDSLKETGMVLATQVLDQVQQTGVVLGTQAAEVATQVGPLTEMTLPAQMGTLLPGLLETAIPDPDAGHTNMPGEPPTAEYKLDDKDAQVVDKNATLKADQYDYNLYERPYTEKDMVYRPEVDILTAQISSDPTFFYVTVRLKGVNPLTKTLDAAYGIELDTDRDGRGDYLVWALSPGSTSWTTDKVTVYTDGNNDVGGKRPLRPDEGSKTDGYEKVLFPVSGGDPDGAWVRVKPDDSTSLQFAFKRGLLDSAKDFTWGVWADAVLKSPASFDYNDVIKVDQAGSPVEGADNYPLRKLNSIDSTCRLGYGQVKITTEIGVCGSGIDLPPQIIPTMPSELPPLPGGLPGGG